MNTSNKKYIQKLYKCITANTSAIWQHAAHTIDQLSSPSCWTGTIQKSLSLNEKKCWRIFGKKFRRMDQQADKDKTERVKGLGRRTREQSGIKWQPWDSRQRETSDIPVLPWGVLCKVVYTKQIAVPFHIKEKKKRSALESSQSLCRSQVVLDQTSWQRIKLLPTRPGSY